MDWELGSHVRVKSGDYTGYYGEVVEVDGDLRRVSLHPDWEGYTGFWIDVADLESNG